MVRLGKLEARVAPKIKMRGKGKTPDDGFSDHEDNSSSEIDIRKSKSKKKKKSSKGHKRSRRKRSS